MKVVWIAGLAALGLGAAALAGVGRPEGAHAKEPAAGRITVVAIGTVEHAPDQAELSFSVVSIADTAKDALDANARDAGRVIDALKSAGVDAKDIQTQDVSLEPRFTQKGRIDGYTARNSVAVTSTIGKAGDLIDAGVAAGANQVSGPMLSVAERDKLYQQALKDAVDAARAKAEAIAAAAGVDVGRVTSVVENTAPEPMYDSVRLAAEARVPIEAGTQEIQANVTVSFAIS